MCVYSHSGMVGIVVFGRDGLQVSTGIFTQIWCMVETNTVYTAAAAFMKIGFTVR